MNNEEKILALLEQLQQGQTEMRADIAELKKDVRKIDDRTAHVEQEYGRKISGIYESIVGTGEKFSRLDVVEDKVDDHNHRIFALEQAAKAE